MNIFNRLIDATSVGATTAPAAFEINKGIEANAEPTLEELRKQNVELTVKLADAEDALGDTKNVFITPETLSFSGSTLIAGPLAGLVSLLFDIDSFKSKLFVATAIAAVFGIFFYKLSVARASDKAKAKKDFKLVSKGVAFANTVLLVSAITGVVSLFPDGNKKTDPPVVTTTTTIASPTTSP